MARKHKDGGKKAGRHGSAEHFGGDHHGDKPSYHPSHHRPVKVDHKHKPATQDYEPATPSHGHHNAHSAPHVVNVPHVAHKGGGKNMPGPHEFSADQEQAMRGGMAEGSPAEEAAESPQEEAAEQAAGIA